MLFRSAALSERFDLFFDLGYGGHYVLPYKVIYEFKNNIATQDLVVERKLNNSEFIPNDFLFGAGCSFSKNEKYKWYLLGHYRMNRQATLYKLPDYFDLSLGLFFK